MRVLEGQTIYLDEQIGVGSESTVHLGHTENGPEQSVIKLPHLLGSWQDQSTETKIAYLDVLRKYGLPNLPTVIHDRPNIVDKKSGKKFMAPNASESPLVKPLHNLTFTDLHDPKIMSQMLEMVAKIKAVKENENLGVDPYGSESMADLVKSIPKESLHRLKDVFEPFLPELIQGGINQRIQRGVLGQMRNIVIGETDHELTESEADYYNTNNKTVTKKGRLTLLDNGLMKGSAPGVEMLHEIMMDSLSHLLQQIDPTIKTDQLMYGPNPRYAAFARLITDFMIPQYQIAAGMIDTKKRVQATI